ncbi:MAG: Mfa1 family fimbria major subunit [Candidatus Amulumruptor caecigallinarius]|nr:Mfa1 family fimbria major subunit [Candidatus Amulumruptor caecigallinarius]MCM1395983.1 Mfa1 family fimbria major subunit [Candidatus Amulumruptor caecigallinarius]MCM1453015.1 Mfa1 family fimbria major subunit [bacterium]
MRFRNFLSASAAGVMVVMTACSSEEPAQTTPTAIAGEKTFASFSISMANVQSRAQADDNADPVEQTIDAITLYIFSGGVLEQSFTPTISDAKTEAVEVTTGEKVIFAVANGATMSVTPESTTLAEFRSRLRSASVSTIATEGNFDMTGSATAIITKCTKAEAEAAPISLGVSRSAAKVQVKYDPEAVNVRATLRATFADGHFTIAQSTKQMRMVLDKNTPIELGTPVGGIYANYEQPAANPVWKATLTEGFSAAFNRSLYTGESYNAEPVTGNTTYAMVRLKVTPTQVYNSEPLASDGTFYVLARHDEVHGSYVFASDNDYNLLYFATEKDATAYKAEANLNEAYEIMRYAEGLAYYRVNLQSETAEGTALADKYCVLRNHFYRVNVTDVKALGAPTEAGTVPTNPDEPLEADAWLAAEISVDPWLTVDYNTSLQ